ncbi:hypothetical protein AB0H00_29000 [Nocardia sp. NPDC023852]
MSLRTFKASEVTPASGAKKRGQARRMRTAVLLALDEFAMQR